VTRFFVILKPVNKFELKLIPPEFLCERSNAGLTWCVLSAGVIDPLAVGDTPEFSLVQPTAS